MSEDNRKKIVVLGGGMGSLSSVFELTNQSNWAAQYDITVYQLGWRLGGKGASGRSLKPASQSASTEQPDAQVSEQPTYRIEEHGLHIFFGFYYNAFRLMKQCYEELGEDGPFSSVEDAFKPHDFVVLEDFANGVWTPWEFNFPRNDLQPWEGQVPGSLWQHVISALELAYQVWTDSEVLAAARPTCPTTPAGLETVCKQIYRNLEALGLVAGTLLVSASEELVQLLLREPQEWFSHMGKSLEQANQSVNSSHFGSEGVYLHLARELAQSLSEDHRHHNQEHHQVLLKLVERFLEELESVWRKQLNEDLVVRRDLIMVNWALANVRAILAEGVLLEPSLDVLDKYDYGEWIKSYGAWQETLDSPMVRSIYDLAYAYPRGDISNPQMGAGVALRVTINLFFRYNGAIMWKMQAGMGDVIFAPLYQVLKRRGVKFKFFHRVTALNLSEDQSTIGSIEVSRQVNLQSPEADYDPLIEVKGLQCWPSEPLYEQIEPEQAAELQEQNINLESFWTSWQDPQPPLQLTARTPDNPDGDFDWVILGISLAALPHLCKSLLQADRTEAAQASSLKWRTMFDKVKTVATQGGQLWLTPTLSQLGWTQPSPVVGTYVEPLDTYADMTHLLPRENWPADNYPNNIAYFTGVMADPPEIPPASDHEYPARAQAAIELKTEQFLQNQIGYLWPKATLPNNPKGLNPELVVSKYWRINIFPTERYVLAVPGSTQHRLKANESGFENLYLTGDWIRNGWNVGAIEPTVVSGLQTAKVILQEQFDQSPKEDILGEKNQWL